MSNHPEPLADEACEDGIVLPSDRPRVPQRPGVERALTRPLAPGLVESLTGLCDSQGLSPLAVVKTALCLTLGRYTRATRVRLDDLECCWEQDPTFVELAASVGQELVQGGPIGGDTRAQVAIGLGDLALEERELVLGWHLEGRPRVAARYDHSLFAEATAFGLVDHVLRLLESALGAPEQPVSRLRHTTNAELDTLTGWSVEGRHHEPAEGLVDIFRRRAEATPDAVALDYAGRTHTYAEALDRSRAWARVLRARGIGSEDVVGLSLARSAEQVLAMLAIVTAGAAYVPLDPDYPQSRLEMMLEDCAARLVLTDHPDRAVTWFSGQTLPLAELDAESQRAAGGDPLPEPHPDQTACVLFTSGSTGRPKGVATPHRGIVRLVCNASYFPCTAEDVVGQASSPSFDAASLEIWGALLNGARLVGLSKEEVLSAPRLAARIAESGLTTFFLTTSVFHLHADVAPELFAPLRAVYFGGEAADARRVAAVRRAAPGVRLVNGYGPTECTTFASAFTAEKIDEDGGGLPIGQPLPDTSLHVLDDRGRRTGIGVPGELYIGGAGLGRGYVGRPAQTAERFVASPLGGGARLYRTGDLARWRPDGLLEHLGRVDTQVKIRGVRIETEEVSSVLSAHPDVDTAVVVARGEGERRALAAYLVPRAECEVDRLSLRVHLSEWLPEAMVPSWYVPITTLPLTVNGKLDLARLPEPGPQDAPRAGAYVAPRDAIEAGLISIWAEVLETDQISVADDFVALGGNSLLAGRVAGQIAYRLGARVGIGELLRSPILADVAARVRAASGHDDEPDIVRLRDGPLPLSYAQQRMWFLDQLNPGSPLYTVSVVLGFKGDLDEDALAAALRHLVRRHPALRTVLVADGPETRQVVRDEVDVPLVREDLCERAGSARLAAAEEAMNQQVREPFDLVTGPLIRARLLTMGDRLSHLFITMHHAICDGWSVGVMVDDLADLYAAELYGREPELPLLPVTYADFSQWQRRMLEGGARERQLAYWTRQLEGAPSVLELPTDRPRPTVPRYEGDSLELRLAPGLTERLTEASRARGVTPFTTLVAVYQLLLGRLAGVSDVCVGTAAACRTRAELEPMVGCFINTLVLRSRWNESTSFAEYLDHVRMVTLDAYDNQDLPFEDIVEALNPPRVAGLTPLVQTMVAMQNIPAGTERFPGLTASLRELSSRVAKLDLGVRWAESPGRAGELNGFAEYDIQLFDRATIEWLMAQYVRLLETALADPLQSLACLLGSVAPRPGRAEARHEPQPGSTDSASSDLLDGVAFTGELEALVAGIWRRVLQLDSVGTEDNFFEVGGTSLQILRVQEGLLAETGRKVPVVDLFRFPSVRALARHLAAEEDGERAPGRSRAAARRVSRAARQSQRTSRRQKDD